MFFDARQRLCMTIDDDTMSPGQPIRAVPWHSDPGEWGAPENITVARLARMGDLSDSGLHALQIPAAVPGEAQPARTLLPLPPPGTRE